MTLSKPSRSMHSGTHSDHVTRNALAEGNNEALVLGKSDRATKNLITTEFPLIVGFYLHFDKMYVIIYNDNLKIF